MRALALVFIGAGLGGVARHALNAAAARALGPAFPWGILLINLAGCFAIGLIAGLWAARGEPAPAWRPFLVTGVLGGFTTFSAFSLDAATLWGRGEHGAAAAYVLASVAGALAAVAAGLTLGSRA